MQSKGFEFGGKIGKGLGAALIAKFLTKNRSSAKEGYRVPGFHRYADDY